MCTSPNFAASLGPPALDNAADRCGKPEAPNGSAEIDGSEHGAAVGFEHDGHAGVATLQGPGGRRGLRGLRRIVANESQELARGIGRYHPRGRDQLPARGGTGSGRAFGQEGKAHR